MSNSILRYFFRNNPFALAAKIGDLNGLKILVNNDPKILTQKDEEGESLLHKAAVYGHVDICQYLVEKGVPVDIEIPNAGATPLMMAVLFNNLDVVKYLLSKGANINKQEDDGVTSLHYAVGKNFPQMVSFLLENKKINLSLKDKINRTALDLAKESGLTDIVLLFKKK